MRLFNLQVAKILGKERTASYLRESFYSLLKDPALLVQSKLFGILHVVLGLITPFIEGAMKFLGLKLARHALAYVLNSCERNFDSEIRIWWAGFHQGTSVCRIHSQKPQPTQT